MPSLAVVYRIVRCLARYPRVALRQPARHRLAPLVLSGCLLLTDVTLACSSMPAHSDISQDEALQLTESGRIRPFGEILDMARQRRDGKLLEAELGCEHHRFIYEVDILDHDGRIWELRFNAVTGEYLSAEKD